MAQGFKKGYDERRNTAGRPRGTGNKDVETIRRKLREFLYSKIPELTTIYKDLQNEKKRPGAKEQIAMIEKIMKHVMPTPVDELMKLSDKDLDKIIEKLKEERLRVV